MQNGVTISTKESDLEVKYGMIHFREEREMARSSLRYILHDMNDIRTSYIRLGFHLEEFRRCGYYYDFGYPTMEEFCGVNLGLDKSAISRCINVFKKFSACEKETHKMWIDDRYKDYSYSQLCEMVSMDEEQCKQVTPDMTIKQIREVKKGNVSRDVSPVATSQPLSYKEYVSSPPKKRARLIKECDSKDSVSIDVFDKNGKFIYGNFWCDLICTQEGHYMFRLDYADE